jgi:sideroflexin-5
MPLLFWSWVNQSQNALVNYYNRNASSPMSNETLAKSYAAAVGSALAVAFGLATLIQRRFDAQKAKSMLRWVAFPSAVVASSLNCYIVRSPEIVSGIPLLDQDGNDVLPGETSQVAATRGVNSTTISRALLQAPVYFLPPLLVSTGPLQRVIAKNPTAAVPITTFLLLVAFGVGLPATVAVFPQIAEIEPDQVEDKFKHLRHPKTLQPYTAFYYNKGL